MKTTEQLIVEIGNYIERLRKRNKKIVYYPSLEMTRQTARDVENYFLSLGYTTSFKRCIQCANRYDVILEWL